MTLNEILDKATYMQFPLTYTTYFEYGDIGKEIHRLPLPSKGMMYDGWSLNNNHFVPEYHRKYVIPMLVELLKINFNENDFTIDERKHDNFDISILKPKKEFTFDVFGFTQNKHDENVSWDFLTTRTNRQSDITDYHALYVYSHECSRIINKTIDFNRKLIISGDSQLIPNIAFLACFFKELWYFDNRKKINLSDKWGKVDFSDVLIELNNKNLDAYTKRNLI